VRKKYFLKDKKYLVREKRSCTFATPKRKERMRRRKGGVIAEEGF
jgi:hypothetical protein